MRWILLCLVLSAGCVQSVHKDSKPHESVTPIEAEAFKACQQRDAVAASLLFKLADELEAGTVKYDRPLMDRVTEINTIASLKSFKELTQQLAVELNKGASLDGKKAAAAVRAYGRGRARASEPLPL